jgi:hypothetical protein
MDVYMFNPACTPAEQHHARRAAAALWVLAATLLAALSTWANEPLLA